MFYGHFTCPECGERFQVPAEGCGAIIECVACPWFGVMIYVDDPDANLITLGPLAE